ncbi:uncharacterized protein LOC132725108 [Ruditapes philippinarum]|uniref:uncharacterized protein LOC132725108 n=1 Tax=Ruditapes philippinarum TaxID=129788 RepID=UPI00295B3EAF|nr:uncharacterized protein LOC132725108 [Ruditapes philippinarum]
MEDCQIDPEILTAITDKFFDTEPYGDFQIIEKGDRLFRKVNPDEFLIENENENTRKKTVSDMKLVNAFFNSKNEARLPEFIPPDQLNDYLCDFILAVTKKDGSEYEPTTLRGFIGSVDRHLKAAESTVSIFKDKEFAKTRAILKRKQQQLKKLGLGNKPHAAEALDEEMIGKMYECGTLGTKTPKALIHSLWLICTSHFGMRTGKEIHQLCWGDINIGLDEASGSEFISFTTERQTKTRSGDNPRDTRAIKPRAYAITEDPEKDPVHIYRTYESKRPIEMCKDDSPFFLSPGSKTHKCWFKKCPMGMNAIYGIMNEMKAESGIENPRITPYSSRKRMIQKLSDEGVPANQIMQISGHKNINSINNYSKLNPNQNRQISDILSNKPSSTVSSYQSTVEQAETTRNLEKPWAFQSNGFPQGFFTNSNIHGNVIINMGKRTESQQLSQTNNLQISC